MTTFDLSNIAPEFAFVSAKGLVTTTTVYKPDAFGNAVVIVAGDAFSLRFERDRGQVFVDAGTEAIGWFKLEYVLEYVDSSIVQQELGQPPRPAAMASLLQSHWDKVDGLFRDSTGLADLQAFAQKKSQEALRGLFNGTGTHTTF